MCSGPKCIGTQHPKPLNQHCTNNACKACCTVLSLSSGLSCRVSYHNANAMRDTSSQTSTSTSHSVLPPHTELIAASQSRINANTNYPRQTFARMLSPLHVQKLQDNDFAYNREGHIQVSIILFYLFSG